MEEKNRLLEQLAQVESNGCTNVNIFILYIKPIRIVSLVFIVYPNRFATTKVSLFCVFDVKHGRLFLISKRIDQKYRDA